ncbi:hypothetical protein GOP47_0020234 [Adiantum capillus-veneris]|uniref:Uncharacterized protein n=1 Tax=Adiantum capillus-veneris TaxID=13818 RepID=A0A9D4UCL0_ADICA|nr:hypothetical protein GOP47_0020234 [Adiantum capillus-veneris]
MAGLIKLSSSSEPPHMYLYNLSCITSFNLSLDLQLQLHIYFLSVGDVWLTTWFFTRNRNSIEFLCYLLALFSCYCSYIRLKPWDGFAWLEKVILLVLFLYLVLYKLVLVCRLLSDIGAWYAGFTKMCDTYAWACGL